eukprot:scaffold126_cov315-Pavlova_lutheri.AAC.32
MDKRPLLGVDPLHSDSLPGWYRRGLVRGSVEGGLIQRSAFRSGTQRQPQGWSPVPPGNPSAWPFRG